MSELKEGKRPLPPPTDLTLRAGAFLFKEGDLSRELYIVKTGELLVTQRHGSQTVELARLGPRAVLGEMSLLDNQPRSATVRAVTESTLMVIAPLTFQRFLKQAPVWLLAIVKVVTHRLRDTNARINQHTVSNSLESLCLYLAEKSHLYFKHYKQNPVLQWFATIDEMTLLTRMKREEIQKAIQTLVERKLCNLTSSQELVIPDPLRLEILANALACERRQEPFAPAELDPLITNTLAYLETHPGPWEDANAMVDFIRDRVEARFSIQQVQKLKDLQILLRNAKGELSINHARLAWVRKAQSDYAMVMGRSK